MPRRDDLKTIMVLGSGPIKIGKLQNLTSQEAKRSKPSGGRVRSYSCQLKPRYNSKRSGNG